MIRSVQEARHVAGAVVLIRVQMPITAGSAGMLVMMGAVVQEDGANAPVMR